MSVINLTISKNMIDGTLKISVCIIAKNEERYIETCLKSVTAIATEIIILDTGSTDKTKQIASKYGKVYDYKWQDDFSLVRNEVIKYAKGQWILILDADEELSKEAQEHIIPFLKKVPNKAQPIAISLKILELYQEHLNITYKNILFKNGYGIKFVKPINEHIFHPKLIVSKADFITIYNSRNKNSTKEEIKLKAEQYISKVLSIIKENKKPADNYFYYYYLGNKFNDNNKPTEALKAYQNSYKSYLKYNLNKKEPFYYNILVAISKTLLFKLNNTTEVLIFIDELLTLAPNNSDPLFFKAYYYQKQEKYEKAIEIYLKTIDLIKTSNTDSIETNSLQDYFYATFMLEFGRCYLALDIKDKALFCFKKAYNENPKDYEINIFIILCYLLIGDLNNAIKYYSTFNSKLSQNEKNELLKFSALAETDIRYKRFLLSLFEELKASFTSQFEVKTSTKRNKIVFSTKELALIDSRINILQSALIEVHVFVLIKELNSFEKLISLLYAIASRITVVNCTSKPLLNSFEPNIEIIEMKNVEQIWQIKNFCMDYSNKKWVLFIDEKDTPSPEFQNNLLTFLKEQPYQDKAVAFSMNSIYDNNSKINLLRNGFKLRYLNDTQVASEIGKASIVKTSFKI